MTKPRWAAGVAAILTVLAASPSAFAAPNLTGVSPAAATAITDSVAVEVTATSAYVITSITADIGGVTKAMSIKAGSTWGTSLDISSLALGPVTLTLTANDAGGGSTTTTVSLKHDHPPRLTILTPDGTVARPDLRLQASCADTDPYPCASISVDYAGKHVSTASASLDQVVSLASLDPAALNAHFVVTDTAGLTSEGYLAAYVEAGPHLVFVDEVAGRILDVDATRILFEDGSGAVAIKDRTSGTITTYGAISGSRSGHLTSVGAAWTGGEVRAAVVYSRPTYAFRAAGDWAVWCDPGGTGGCSQLHRENLVTGAIETLVTESSSNVPFADPAIDAAGNVAYSSYQSLQNKWQIRWVTTAGVDTTAVTSNAVGPVIDGSNFVYGGHVSFGRAALSLLTSTGTEMLDPTPSINEARLSPYRDYRANDGWVAYTKLVGGVRTAWTRTPAGVTALASALSGVSAIAALNPLGEIAYDVGAVRYLSAAGAVAPTMPLSVGGSFGEMRYIGGDWFKLVGRDVFRIDPAATGPADAGTDAGGPDASDAGGPDASDAGGPDASDAGVDGGMSDAPSSGSPSAADASAPPPGGSDDGGSGGGGCSTTDSSPGAGSLLGVALAAACAAGRRRRRSAFATARRGPGFPLWKEDGE